MIHINRLKLVTDRFNFDISPMNVNVNEYSRDAHENIKMHENVTNEVMFNYNMNMNDNTVNDNVFEVEKISRKRKREGQWEYRVKWNNFSASKNSWENFDNLSVALKEYVTYCHNKIPTKK